MGTNGKEFIHAHVVSEDEMLQAVAAVYYIIIPIQLNK